MKLFVNNDGHQLKAKAELVITSIVTAILFVYAIELGIRILTGGNGRVEYLVVALVIIVILLLGDLRLYSNYEKEKPDNRTSPHFIPET